MAVKRLFQVRQQFLDSSGNLASGYRLFFYVAGQQTKQSTYNSASGTVPNSNPIVLNSLGMAATEIWGTVGQAYKIALAAPGADDPPGAFIWTEDNIACVNDISADITFDQWLPSGVNPTFINSTSFSIPGDKTSDFSPGRRIKTANNGGTVYSTILSSAFTSLTTVTVSNDSPGVLDSGLSSVSYGLITPTNSSMPWSQDDRLTIVDNVDTTKRAQFQLSSITTGTTRTYTFPNASTTIVGTDAAQTLTNKTLDSASINSPSCLNITDTGTTTMAAVGGNARASQAEMEAATATNRLITPANAKYHPGVAKAWVRFDGTGSNGSKTLLASYNVTSVTKNATGDYTVAFTAGFSSAEYLPVISARREATNVLGSEYHATSPSTSGMRFLFVRPDTGAAIDSSFINIAFYGDF